MSDPWEEVARALPVVMAAAAHGPELVDREAAAIRARLEEHHAPPEALRTLEEAVTEARRVARTLAEARSAATTDPLTGLPDRRALQDAPPSAAVLAVDVDHLKAHNDLGGHAAGDALLAQVADALRATLRRVDTVYRVGGDEFAVHLAAADAQEAVSAADRLRRTVAERTAGTVSIGVAVRGPGESAGDAYERADSAAYAAKGAGRDGVALAHDEDEDDES
jgi:diguanylate cyclase (GGDEF)-like protein